MTLNASPRREERHAVRADIRLTGDGGNLVEAMMVDISRHGLGTDALVHFPQDCAIRVDFPDGSHRTGKAVWRDMFWSGILFDSPLAPEELGRLVTSLTLRPRFTRRAA